MKLNFKIAEKEDGLRTHQIIELCEFLSARVLEPMFERANSRWQRRFMNFFTCDNTCDPLEATGTIKFKVPPLFAGQVGELEGRVLHELFKLGIRTGTLEHEQGPGRNDCHILIPILENPTANEVPPEVNISQNRGCLVLRDLLGYEKVNGKYEFTADELLKRAASVTQEKIAECTASPVWDPKVSPEPRRKPSPGGVKAATRCLEEIKRFAQWALNHNYRKLAAV